MGLDYRQLDATTRQTMLQEISCDAADGSLYLSPRLSDEGRCRWPQLLTLAAELHDDVWLASSLRSKGLLLIKEPYVRNGRAQLRSVPVNAAELMAEGEFNRFYIRALCVRAQMEGINTVIVYRARYSANPRAESEMLVGRAVSPAMLLEDLRACKGGEPALLPYVCSGLSVCFQ